MRSCEFREQRGAVGEAVECGSGVLGERKPSVGEGALAGVVDVAELPMRAAAAR